MKNIRHILVPTDFSEAADNSLEYALQLARSTKELPQNQAAEKAGQEGVKLFVLHSYSVPVTSIETAYVADQAILLEQTFRRAEEEMQALEEKYLRPSGLPYECLIRMGSAIKDINEVVKEFNIDLVLMATQKAGKLERLFGDLTAYALEHCKAPLLLVPDEAEFRPLRKLAFATDLHKIRQSEVFDKLKYLAGSFHSHIIVLNVNTDLKDLSQEEAEELQHIKEELRGMEFHLQFIEGEDAEEAILDYVHKQDIDLVAAVPRHHGFFEGLFRSSVSKKLAVHTHIPLLAVHE